MCEFKKLCTCDTVEAGEDHWKLEYRYGISGVPTSTRPEHQHVAQEYSNNLLAQMIGTLPKEMFEVIACGTGDPASMLAIIKDEEKWLNDGNPFDFDFNPFEGDKLTFNIGGNELVFRFFGRNQLLEDLVGDNSTGWRYVNTRDWLNELVRDHGVGKCPKEAAIEYLGCHTASEEYK